MRALVIVCLVVFAASLTAAGLAVLLSILRDRHAAKVARAQRLTGPDIDERCV